MFPDYIMPPAQHRLSMSGKRDYETNEKKKVIIWCYLSPVVARYDSQIARSSHDRNQAHNWHDPGFVVQVVGVSQWVVNFCRGLRG